MFHSVCTSFLLNWPREILDPLNVKNEWNVFLLVFVVVVGPRYGLYWYVSVFVYIPVVFVLNVVGVLCVYAFACFCWCLRGGWCLCCFQYFVVVVVVYLSSSSLFQCRR